MPTVLIASTSYPSYETVADADLFLGGDVFRATAWALRSADAKARGLVSATRLLQSLYWCAGAAPDIDARPDVVGNVTAMLAADGLAKPKLFTNPAGNLPYGIKRVKAGPAEVEFNSIPGIGGAAQTPIPSDGWALLVGAGLVGCSTDDGSNDGPYVSGIMGWCDDRAPGAFRRPFCRDDC